jgi:hypothetical protein
MVLYKGFFFKWYNKIYLDYGDDKIKKSYEHNKCIFDFFSKNILKRRGFGENVFVNHRPTERTKVVECGHHVEKSWG